MKGRNPSETTDTASVKTPQPADSSRVASVARNILTFGFVGSTMGAGMLPLEFLLTKLRLNQSRSSTAHASTLLATGRKVATSLGSSAKAGTVKAATVTNRQTVEEIISSGEKNALEEQEMHHLEEHPGHKANAANTQYPPYVYQGLTALFLGGADTLITQYHNNQKEFKLIAANNPKYDIPTGLKAFNLGLGVRSVRNIGSMACFMPIAEKDSPLVTAVGSAFVGTASNALSVIHTKQLATKNHSGWAVARELWRTSGPHAFRQGLFTSFVHIGAIFYSVPKLEKFAKNTAVPTLEGAFTRLFSSSVLNAMQPAAASESHDERFKFKLGL